MYNTYDRSNVYFYYDFLDKTHFFIGNKQDLIRYLAKGFHNNYFSNKIEHNMFKNVNMGNDIYHYKKVTYTKINDQINCEEEDYIFNKRYLFYDGMNRIIDIRFFYDECLKYYEENKNKRSYFKYKKYYPSRKKHTINKYKNKMANNKKCVKTIDCMLTQDPDFKEYNFKKLENSKNKFPDWWDDTYRRVQGNWKKQYKVNKQYNIHNGGKNNQSIRQKDIIEYTQDDIDEMIYEYYCEQEKTDD